MAFTALAPDIIEKPRDEKTVEGRAFTMTCRVLGSPKPAVKWVRNGVELTGGRYTTLPSGDLQIRSEKCLLIYKRVPFSIF